MQTKHYINILINLVIITLSLISINAHADAQQNLQSRLDKINVFQSSFVQKVYDADKKLIQSGEGEMWVKRPNLFNWHTLVPDESQLISDGKTLWFYNPFIEQVTATNLADATANTPFILIAGNKNSDWAQYNIKQRGNDFSLTPKSDSNSLKQFDIRVTPAGTIESFVSVELDGQKSEYQLSNQNSQPVSDDKFKFDIPDGVTFDDQR
ncbi:outer membrane lipoprotein chaperone LolA [Thorsellia anophelis]|uniref:Outer-membrane lipoprotein carrier protein n=1 Tax=Thorsellia anophelis DSM 18579 TaxID=1123402 RepID=A0A1H9ZU17_9GAMM|nr:outer membrane lipoprotein chaperone LolA [Thorsellia anophelis]SES85274.1 outer membrane lipoprotein carrier protein [Thorsellia anophelis DSM 18579]